MDMVVTAVVAFVLAGFVKGVLGFGFPIIALVVLTLTIGLLDALAVIVIPTLVTNVWQAFAGSHLRAIMQRMWLYFSVAMLGILVSSQYLALVNVNWLTALLGIILFIFSLSRLLDIHLTVREESEPILSVVLGSANGLLTGLTGTFMVPSVLYMQALGFGKDMLVQAMGAFFALSTLMLIISLGRNGLISIEEATMSTLALLPSFAGIYAGRWTREQINEDQFQRLFLIAVLLLGAYLAWRSVNTLW
jgi:uncharacterized membrane protein YfcA